LIKAIVALELPKIIEQLEKFTRTFLGRQLASSLKPSLSPEKVNRLQDETSEAVEIIRENKLSFAPCDDLFPYLQRASRGGILSAKELVEIGSFLKALEAVKTTFSKYEYAAERFPLFQKYIGALTLFPSLCHQLQKTFLESGEIREDATPVLYSLHREEKNLQERIHKCMESYLRSQHYRKYLQENVITIRNERYVLPVKQEYRNFLPGLVHDQSASGQTLFIEPFPAVELNNQLQMVKKQINEEIERLLYQLTLLVAGKSDAIRESLEIYGKLDFILARGYLSIAQDAIRPVVNNRGYIRIVQGRHPLIPNEKVIPIDLHLGSDFNTLIITGPNTGGKTVTLKIIGLFVLMAQCGLHLPAESGTETAVFDGIWADIGDEQSMEQSLSTFSGHMKNIIQIVEEASSSSLVLLDEIGAGTDPSEGSALAMAILDELHLRGVKTVATTHINELKIFAHMREGMENASMEFDSTTMAPTFRLMIGVPGQSNAFAIAERLGLHSQIISKARSFVRKDFLDLDEVVSGLVEEKRKFAENSREIEEIKIDIQANLQKLEEEKKKLEKQRKDILQKARDEAYSIIRKTKRETEGILKKLYRAEREREKSTTEALALGEEARSSLKKLQEDLSLNNESTEARRSLKAEELQEGLEVYINSLRSYGRIIRIYTEEEIQVQAGLLKVNTRLKDLSLPLETKKAGEKGKNRVVSSQKSEQMDLIREKSNTLRPRLDLRGMTLEEAVLKLDKYLDDALLTGLDTFDIIHGKGTGRLRQGVHHYLKNLNQVAAFRLGGEGEGGSGATIVQLRKN